MRHTLLAVVMSGSVGRTRREAVRLQQKFIRLLTNTQVHFLSEESKDPLFFKTVQLYLINCQLSAQFENVSVVHREKERIS